MLSDTVTTTTASESSSSEISRGVWSEEEHDLFLEALQKYPNGPWKAVAGHVGTRSVRQVQTHAQKYHEKVARRLRGLRKDRKRVRRPEHRLDDDMLEICEDLKQDNALLAPKPADKRRRQRSTKTMAALAAKSLETQAQGRGSFSDAETKLSASMDNVHVTEVGDGGGETESQATDNWLAAIEPTNTPLDDMDESFFEALEYLIEALSSSDSENDHGSD